MKYFCLFFLIYLQVKAQVIPQCDRNSCWAASLAMVSKKVDIFPKSICHFLNLIDGSTCNGINCASTTITKYEMENLTKENLSSYTTFKFNSSLGLHHIEELLNNNKPIIYNFKYDATSSHIVVMNKINYLNKPNKSKQILIPKTAFIEINDPWPTNKGSVYYQTYEGYYIQNLTYDKPENINPSKYTISWDSCKKNDNIGINRKDMEYLKEHVLFNEDYNQLAISLKNLLTTSNMSIDFYANINFDRSIGAEIRNEYSIIAITDSTYLGDFSTRNIESKLDRFLQYSYNRENKLIEISQNDKISSILSVSNKQMKDSYYPFYNNWIINHIEGGNYFEEMNTFIQNNGFSIAGKEKVLLKGLGTLFILLERDEKIYAYDIYNEFLAKQGTKRTIEITDLHKFILNNQKK